MKNIKHLLYFFFTAGFFFSCERELETEGISRIIEFPTFAIEGDEIVTLVKGTSFTDPGVTAREGENSLPVTSSVLGSGYIVPGQTQPSQVTYTTLNTVDTNVPGIYIITYSATNKDGYSGSVTRTIFVLDKPADPTVDLSGNYTSGTSPAATITKVADGVWYSSNAWGGGSTVVIPAYIISTDGINIQVPQQESLVRIFGYGTRALNGNLNMKMSRPTFANPAPIIDLDKIWVKS